MSPTQPESVENETELEHYVQDFLNTLESFQTLVVRYHFHVKTHSERSLKTFIGLPKLNQTEIIQGFTDYLAFLVQCELDGVDLRDDKKLVNAFLQRFGFIYDEGLNDNICNGDVVEIYSMGQKQIFRNLVFMDLCNYTLLDLLAHDPYELYERSEKIKAGLNEVVSTLANRPYNLEYLNMSHLPKHILRERFSEKRLSSVNEFKATYPLYTWPPKNIAGFIVIQRGRNLDEATPELSFI